MVCQYTTPSIQRQDSSLAVDNYKKQKTPHKKLFMPPANTSKRNIEVFNL